MADTSRVCLCGCGTPVTNKWVRGHAARGVAGFTGDPPAASGPIPGPDDPWWENGEAEDLGDVEADPDPDLAASFEGAKGEAGPVYEPGPVTPDPPPAHGKREWRRGGPKPPPRKPTRITATLRNDIDAKISLALEIPGRVWQARDPLCGGTFIEQRAEISAAFTEIVLESPDLIAWFSGSGGMFMKVLNACAACWPVATMCMAHHVYHSVELDDGQGDGAEATRYAA